MGNYIQNEFGVVAGAEGKVTTGFHLRDFVVLGRDISDAAERLAGVLIQVELVDGAAVADFGVGLTVDGEADGVVFRGHVVGRRGR